VSAVAHHREPSRRRSRRLPRASWENLPTAVELIDEQLRAEKLVRASHVKRSVTSCGRHRYSFVWRGGREIVSLKIEVEPT
jgi:hypothetical protein